MSAVIRTELDFRPLTVTDGEALADFFTALAADAETVRFFHPHPLTREYAAKLCSERSHSKDRYFAMWYRGTIVGYAMLRGWDEGYAIPKFGACVHPGYRRRGVGNVLWERAIAESRKCGVSTLLGSVYTDNVRSVHLGEKYGIRWQDQGNGTMVGRIDFETGG